MPSGEKNLDIHGSYASQSLFLLFFIQKSPRNSTCPSPTSLFCPLCLPFGLVYFPSRSSLPDPSSGLPTLGDSILGCCKATWVLGKEGCSLQMISGCTETGEPLI